MKVSTFLLRENNNLDLIRILLASFVIVAHAPVLNGNSSFWFDPVYHFLNFTDIGAVSVCLFFFISGLVITNSVLANRSAMYFIISRSFRILPALLFVLLITVFVLGPIVTDLNLSDYFTNIETYNYLLKNLQFDTIFRLPGVFENNLFKLSINGSLWTLRYEVGCYIALFGAFLLLGNGNKLYLNFPAILVIIDTFLPERFILGWLGTRPEVYLLPASFAFGVFFAINSDRIEINFKLFLGFCLLFYTFRSTHFYHLLFNLTSCVLILYIASIGFVLKFKPKYDISYGIYLFGFLVQQTLYYLFGHIFEGFHCIIALIISIFLAIITHLLVEKPFISLGKKTYRYYIESKFARKYIS